MTLKVDVIEKADGSPVELTGQRSAKGHGHFDQTTTSLRGNSFNISSCVDFAIGDTRFNLTNAMADADYIVSASTIGYPYAHFALSTTQFGAGGVTGTGSWADWNRVGGVIYGDLA